MGTYFELQLKDTSEKNIKGINNSLIKLGYKNSRTDDPIYQGAFNTRELLKAEAKFMNEDPEGLKQVTHIERPITPEYLQTFIWNKLGFYQAKLSCIQEDTPELTRELTANLEILSKFWEDNPDLFNLERCDNCDMSKVLEYTKPVLDELDKLQDNSKDNNEGFYGQGEQGLKTIVIRIKNGLAEVDETTIPAGIEIEVRDYDLQEDGDEDDGIFNDQDGNYRAFCVTAEEIKEK